MPEQRLQRTRKAYRTPTTDASRPFGSQFTAGWVHCAVCAAAFFAEFRDDQPPPYFCQTHRVYAPWYRG